MEQKKAKESLHVLLKEDTTLKGVCREAIKTIYCDLDIRNIITSEFYIEKMDFKDNLNLLYKEQRKRNKAARKQRS